VELSGTKDSFPSSWSLALAVWLACSSAALALMSSTQKTDLTSSDFHSNKERSISKTAEFV
jgi:hypothetical protein